MFSDPVYYHLMVETLSMVLAMIIIIVLMAGAILTLAYFGMGPEADFFEPDEDPEIVDAEIVAPLSRSTYSLASPKRHGGTLNP